MTDFPVIRTKRLILRRPREEDTEAVFGLYSREDVTRFYDLAPFTRREQAAELVRRFDARFTNQTGLRWMIVLAAERRVIGDCGFTGWVREHARTDLGYAIAPDCWGRGYAVEACAAAIRYAFDELPLLRLNRIEATTDPANAASRRVLEKLGFQYEGRLRQRALEKGRFVDECFYALLREEYEAQQAPSE